MLVSRSATRLIEVLFFQTGKIQYLYKVYIYTYSYVYIYLYKVYIFLVIHIYSRKSRSYLRFSLINNARYVPANSQGLISFISLIASTYKAYIYITHSSFDQDNSVYSSTCNNVRSVDHSQKLISCYLRVSEVNKVSIISHV